MQRLPNRIRCPHYEPVNMYLLLTWHVRAGTRYRVPNLPGRNIFAGWHGVLRNLSYWLRLVFRRIERLHLLWSRKIRRHQLNEHLQGLPPFNVFRGGSRRVHIMSCRPVRRRGGLLILSVLRCRRRPEQRKLGLRRVRRRSV